MADESATYWGKCRFCGSDKVAYRTNRSGMVYGQCYESACGAFVQFKYKAGSDKFLAALGAGTPPAAPAAKPAAPNTKPEAAPRGPAPAPAPAAARPTMRTLLDV